jgi:hypothetical protein
VDDYRIAYRALAVGIDRRHRWKSSTYTASYRRNRTYLSAYYRSQGCGLTSSPAFGLWTRLFLATGGDYEAVGFRVDKDFDGHKFDRARQRRTSRYRGVLTGELSSILY